MPALLTPCPECRRHARGENACPFCGAPVPQARPPRRAPVGTTRAVLFGLALGASACGESHGPLDGGPVADAGSVADAGVADPDAGGPDDAGSEPDGGPVAMPYGAPPVDYLV